MVRLERQAVSTKFLESWFWKFKNLIIFFYTINSLQDVIPDPASSCGPYTPNTSKNLKLHLKDNPKNKNVIDANNHDTIGMITIDNNGNIAAGTSTNGLKFKIPG